MTLVLLLCSNLLWALPPTPSMTFILTESPSKLQATVPQKSKEGGEICF